MAIKRDIKVGLFVLVGLILMGVVVFLIGDERSLFEAKDDYKAVFEDVQGLKPGSPVRMGGIDVGSVSKVAYSDDAKDLKLYVTLSIVRAEARRIRVDSTVSIEGKGLLGDKMVVLTAGDPEKDRIPAGGVISTEQTASMEATISKLTGIGDKVDKVVSNLEKTTHALSNEQFTNDLQGTLKSLNSILRSVDQGDGYASKLLHDKKEAEKLSRTLSNLERSSAELDRTLRGVNSIVGRVQTGPGFAHEVLYEKGPGESLNQFGGAAQELALTLKGIREGNGPAHSIIYGDDQSQQLMGNINAMSRDLRHIVADVRAGKGTVGALLVDPSVYEDIKMVLGNVDRNKTLRALVRYSIKQDEKAPRVDVADPKPAPIPKAAESGSASLPAEEKP
ncbi:MAG: MCE family protein [Myxococcales bacterium]|nr:MCE family protein [Myxococcales bacterium]